MNDEILSESEKEGRRNKTEIEEVSHSLRRSDECRCRNQMFMTTVLYVSETLVNR